MQNNSELETVHDLVIDKEEDTTTVVEPDVYSFGSGHTIEEAPAADECRVNKKESRKKEGILYFCNRDLMIDSKKHK